MFTPSEFRAKALSLVGLPYVLGAEASYPTFPRALDCSELVEWLLDGNGTPIGDLAAAQYDKTVAVSSGGERVGDLVFLRNNSARWNGIGHVAILTAKLANGDWEIVEARGTYFGVVRTTLSYWKMRNYYTGVRRFPKFSLKPEYVNYSTSSQPVLKLGSRGEAVRMLQRFALDNFGTYAGGIRSSGGADSVFGAGTESWVMEFQRRTGLVPDGIVGAKTWARLAQYGMKMPNVGSGL